MSAFYDAKVVHSFIDFLAREFELGMLLTMGYGAGGESAGSVGLGTEGVAVGGDDADDDDDDDDDDNDDVDA